MEGLTATLTPEKTSDCKFIKTCRDMNKLRESYNRRDPNENLLEQYYELCSCGGDECPLRDFYLNQSSQTR